MDINELLMTAWRATAVYLLMLIVVRALGKRTVGNFSAFDLIVALMLGEIVDEMIYGDVRFAHGAVAMVTLGAIAYGESLLSYWDHGMEAILEGKPTIVVKNGDFNLKGMRQERMNEKDVLATLRMEGIRDLREVQYAIVEHDGTVSVIPYEWAQEAVKADVDKEMSKARDEALGGKEEPPPSKRTVTPKALDRTAQDMR